MIAEQAPRKSSVTLRFSHYQNKSHYECGKLKNKKTTEKVPKTCFWEKQYIYIWSHPTQKSTDMHGSSRDFYLSTQGKNKQTTKTQTDNHLIVSLLRDRSCLKVLSPHTPPPVEKGHQSYWLITDKGYGNQPLLREESGMQVPKVENAIRSFKGQ